jgi:hypothetical protein
MKKCSICKRSLSFESFGKDSSIKSGLSYKCRECNRVGSALYRKMYPERIDHSKKAVSNKRTRERYLVQWTEYLQDRFGDPICQVCQKQLKWFDSDASLTVNFDHRHGHDAPIQTKRDTGASVSNWIRTRPCNDRNINIFEECDFGILCIRCNSSLPTADREEWVRNVNHYVFGDQEVIMYAKCIDISNIDWEY